MNKNQHIVFSEARKFHVTAHGMPLQPPLAMRRLASAITAVLLALGGGEAIADSCTGVSTIISSAVTDQCNLSNESVTVTSGSSIVVSTAFTPGVVASNGTNEVNNSGTITGDYYGIRNQIASSMTLINSGSITGWGTGVENLGTLTTLTNTGTISSSNGAGIDNSGGVSAITTLTNSGTISGLNYGIRSFGTITTLNNSGTISSGSGPGIGNIGAITTLNNSGTISSIDPVWGTIGTLNNSGTISGALNMKAGTLNLNGTSGRLTGAVSSTGAGTVNVNGTFTTENTFNVGVLAIANGGVFNQAHGVTVANGFANDGTLAIPTSTTSTITGNYGQTGNGVFRSTISGDTSYGKLVVTGTATLPSGAKIDVNVANPNFRFTAARLENIISAGTLTSDGTFSVTDNSLLFDFSAVKDGNTVDLAITSVAPAIETSVKNQGNVPGIEAAKVLDTIITSDPTGPIGSLFVGLTTEQQVSNAVSQTLPLLVGGAQLAASASLTGMNRVVQARIESNRGMSSGEEFYGDKKFWMKPFGSWADQGDRNGVSGFKSNSRGLIFGADTTISDATRMGVAFAYAKADVDGNSTVAPNNANVDVYQLIGYGSHSLDADTELNFQAGIGQNKNESERSILFAGSTAKANYNSLTATAGLGVGRTYKLSEPTSFTPSIRADYIWIKDKGYTETGAGALNLDVNGRSTDALILAMDAKIAHELSRGTSLTANLGLGYDAINNPISITSSFAGTPGSAFTTLGLDPSPWMVRGGLGIVSKTQSGMEISARYDVEHRSDFLNQTASAKLRWAF